jgi:hypothetical protein
VVLQQTAFPIEVAYVWLWSFDISGTGTIDATVDYTYSDTNLLVWIARGSCTPQQFVDDVCQFVATSFAGSKPRRVTATNQTAGTYAFLVGNMGPHDESISYQVVFTQTSTAGAPPSASSAKPSGERVFALPLPGGLRH